MSQYSRGQDSVRTMGVSVLLPVLLGLASTVIAQSDPGSSNREYNKNGIYVPPNPGDSDYRTYTYNSRRYGHYQPTNTQYNPYYPQYPPQQGSYPYGQNGPFEERFDNNFVRDPNNPNAVFPGVLGGWREDIQGKERRDSRQLPRDVFVSTNYGQVQGFKVYLYDNPDPDSGYRPGSTPVERIQGEVSAFLGIPYALPPVLDGRFRPPRPHRGWQLLQAVDFGPACPQPVRFTGATKGVRDMDEDCLYLNIYSPDTSAGVAQKYPVMVYIHGGDFYKGASNTFPAHIMACFYKVVVVSINYRLGALGFLSTGDENSPGNYGLLDQSLALQWIYDNVEFFNGDKNSITLFGPGAGAASAGLLMVAPQTRNIVNKVIGQSGSATADWALIIDKYRAQNTSRVYGQLLGCSIESSWKLVNCLKQGRNFYELGNAEFAPHVGLFPWGPVLDVNFTYPGDDWYEGWHESDWVFLKETPEQLIRKGAFNRGLTYMSGVTLQEAAYVIYENETLAPNFEIDEKFFDEKIKEMVLRYNYTLNPRGVYEAIKYMYTYWPDPHNRTLIREQYINLLSDFFFRAPVDHMVKLLLDQRVPVYLYVMNTTVESLKLPEWRKVPHNIEQYFLTGAPFMDVEFFPSKWKLDRQMWTNNDRNMSHFFMKTFTDFARYGNPTRHKVLGMHYEVARAGELKYLNINTTYNSTIFLNFRQTECAFWSQYLPTVVGHLVPTYPPVTEYWWEPKEPLQIAFWSMSAACLLLVVMLVVCCLLWRQAKREADRCYSSDIFMVHETEDVGIENTNRSRENVYEYRDKPVRPQTLSLPSRPSSQASSGSGLSLKESHYVSSSPNPNGRLTPPPKPKTRSNIKTHIVQGVPQTQV